MYGAFIFGSGLAIVPFLREGVVEQHHWLNADQFLDAVAMGLITPGPVAFVRGATAAAAGAIAGATIVLTRQAVVDWKTAAIALVGLIVIWRWKVQEPLLVVLGAAILGLLLH